MNSIKQQYEQLLLKDTKANSKVDLIPNVKYSEGREVDLNLITDYNERLLQEVGINLTEVDQNMKDTSQLLNKQGTTLKKSKVMVESTEKNIKASDSTLTSLSRGQICQRLLMHAIVILLFILILIIGGIKFLNYSPNS